MPGSRVKPGTSKRPRACARSTAAGGMPLGGRCHRPAQRMRPTAWTSRGRTLLFDGLFEAPLEMRTPGVPLDRCHADRLGGACNTAKVEPGSDWVVFGRRRRAQRIAGLPDRRRGDDRKGGTAIVVGLASPPS